MKFFVRAAFLAASLLAVFQAHAQTATFADQTFNVNATLVSQCKAATPAADQELTIDDYVAFGAQQTGSTVITFNCTKGATPTVAFEGDDGGTLMGLAYTLAVDSAGVDKSANADAAVGGEVFKYTVTATMAAGQAGDATGVLTDSKQHTLRITF